MPTPPRSARCLRAVLSLQRSRRLGVWCRRKSLESKPTQICHIAYIAPHFRSFATRGAPPRQPSRQEFRPRSPVPGKEELPKILTAAGMVKLCGLPGNRAAPLVGLDVAPSNFGVAISDGTRTLAFPFTRVPRRSSTKKLDPSIVLGKLRAIIEETSACGLVVGWPLANSGRAEGQCLMVLQFLRQLRQKGKVDIPVTLFDERLTSVEARGILKDGGLGRKIAEREDETAAMVILQGFLDSAEAEHGGLSTLPTGPGRNASR